MSQRVRYLHGGADTTSKDLSTKRARYHEVDVFRASQSVSLDIAFPIPSHKVVVRSLWLRAAQPTTDFSNALLHSQSGQSLDNNVQCVPRQMPANCSVWSGEISVDTIARGEQPRVPCATANSLA